MYYRKAPIVAELFVAFVIQKGYTMLFQSISNLAEHFHLHDEEGQGMAEYALIIALVAIIVAASLTALAGGIDGVFDTIIAGL